MADKSIFILGASRGIGLGLVKTFLDRGWNVVASERSESADLHALECDALRIVTADVTEPDSYVDLGFEDGQLDALIINAGITGASHQDASRATADEVSHVMMTNAFGPARAAKSLLPAIKDGGTLGVMSSLMGSISDSSGGYELYRTSKTALNMLAKGISEQDASPREIEVLALHPGWVQTDMGGSNAALTIEESVNGLADVIETSGEGGFRFVDYSGKELAF
ncbi:short-chain dehydrogenase [Erythrobacter sp. SAORIC-644]|uniref:SDR family NAD(P)-dependent oxidoreductase n=1 Tax=Erythrobacter sp. SAORIC-644 TaxID=1869314 RepID=UPI000C9FDA68|nr:SDR family NAD(P)-dependent oxidoreductase [Erythrobacter sp. SAORIC-644]PNQ77440.1 short-chain dehydrogenase [Erythrobacter sp. SAORIC-644]